MSAGGGAPAVRVTAVATQLRVTDLARALRFYVDVLGCEEAFRYGDFYAGVRAGGALLHLKLVDAPDPSIAFVRAGEHLHAYLQVADLDAAWVALAGRAERVAPIATTAWGTRECVIRDPDGHTLYLAQAAPDAPA